MSILIDDNTRLVVSGITGREGTFHTGKMIEYGTQVVAGVVPGRGGQKSEHGVPIFDTVAEKSFWPVVILSVPTSRSPRPSAAAFPRPIP